MRAIVGLGNPGTKFERTRHNVGFMVIDALRPRIQEGSFEESRRLKSLIIKYNTLLLIKPQTFMNESGFAVKKILDFYKVEIDNLYVVHDDLDIELGEHKIQKGKGPREHKGLMSIYDRLGSKDFWHVRVGVDNRDEDRIPGEEYVLQRFTDEELKIVNNVVREVSIMLLSETN